MTGAITRRLSSVEPERIDWLWPGRLARGKLHIVDGDPGRGKSTISYDLAARLSTGSPWPDGEPGMKGGTVVMSAEDGLADTIRPRLDAHGADCDRITALTGIRETNPETGEERDRLPDLTDLAAMRAAVEQVDAVMLVIDPFAAYLPPGVDAFKDADVRRALAPLAALAEKLNIAVLIIRHLRKSGGKAIYAGGGSIGIIGAARVGFIVAEDPDDETRTVFAVSKANIAAKAPALAYRLTPDDEHGCARIEWEGTVNVSADDLTAEGEQGDRSALDAAVEWLLGYLEDQGGSAPAADVRKDGQANGHSERTLQRAKQKAKVGHQSIGKPRTTVWIHPKNTDSDTPSRANTPGATGLGATGATGVTSENTQKPSLVAPERHSGATGTPTLSLPITDSKPCDRCQTVTQTRLDGAGNRFCEDCAPQMWKATS